jgi:hypothetical protein
MPLSPLTGGTINTTKSTNTVTSGTLLQQPQGTHEKHTEPNR